MNLEIEKLVFSWPGQVSPLFGPLTLSFEQGISTAIIGPNGVGKSTFLNVLSCRVSASSGSMKLGELPPTQADFNYMLQDPGRLLFSHLRLEQNLYLTRSRNRKATIDDDLLEAFLPSSEILHKLPHKCSVGQRQRAVLLRTLLDLPDFPITLLDEPFSSISRDARSGMYASLKRAVSESSRILIFVTHDLIEACILGDKVIVIKEEQLHQFDASTISSEDDLDSATELRDGIQRAMLT